MRRCECCATLLEPDEDGATCEICQTIDRTMPAVGNLRVPYYKGDRDCVVASIEMRDNGGPCEFTFTPDANKFLTACQSWAGWWLSMIAEQVDLPLTFTITFTRGPRLLK